MKKRCRKLSRYFRGSSGVMLNENGRGSCIIVRFLVKFRGMRDRWGKEGGNWKLQGQASMKKEDIMK